MEGRCRGKARPILPSVCAIARPTGRDVDFSPSVSKQCYAGRAVWIIFNGDNFGGDVPFLAFEINDTVLLAFVSATAVTRRETTLIVAATGSLARRCQCLFWTMW